MTLLSRACVSPYQYFIETTVYEIFSVKEWRDLETEGRGRSRSLKMAPFDRSHTTFYWSAIVNIALSCTVLSYLTLNNIVTLKSRLEVIQDHLNWYHSKAWCGFLFTFHMAVSSTVYEIFNVKVQRDDENCVRGCSRSLKMALFRQIIQELVLVRHCKYSSILYRFELFDVG